MRHMPAGLATREVFELGFRREDDTILRRRKRKSSTSRDMLPRPPHLIRSAIAAFAARFRY